MLAHCSSSAAWFTWIKNHWAALWLRNSILHILWLNNWAHNWKTVSIQRNSDQNIQTIYYHKTVLLLVSFKSEYFGKLLTSRIVVKSFSFGFYLPYFAKLFSLFVVIFIQGEAYKKNALSYAPVIHGTLTVSASGSLRLHVSFHKQTNSMMHLHLQVQSRLLESIYILKC